MGSAMPAIRPGAGSAAIVVTSTPAKASKSANNVCSITSACRPRAWDLGRVVPLPAKESTTSTFKRAIACLRLILRPAFYSVSAPTLRA